MRSGSIAMQALRKPQEKKHKTHVAMTVGSRYVFAGVPARMLPGTGSITFSELQIQKWTIVLVLMCIARSMPIENW